MKGSNKYNQLANCHLLHGNKTKIMRAFPSTKNHYTSPHPILVSFQCQSHASPLNLAPFPSKQSHPTHKHILFCVYKSVIPKCSNSSWLEDSYEGAGEEGTVDLVAEDGVVIEMEKTGKNSRRVRSRIGVNASLDTIWNVLTDYDNLENIIPGLAVSMLLEKRGNCSRIYQVGQQNLPLGFKFRAKAVLESYEQELEILATGRKRDIDFKMIEGDFQIFEGKWSIEQFDKPKYLESLDQEFESTVSYLVDVKPKLWLPLHLIEGRLCKEIKTNLSCVREAAESMTRDNLDTLII